MPAAKEEATMPPKCNDVKDSSTHCSSCVYGEGQSNLPRITVQEEAIEATTVSNEEKLLAFADLCGWKHPEEVETDRHLKEFDKEMCRLPIEQKSALHRGYTVKQARLFLRVENNDARRAVGRMSRYWTRRIEQLGEDAFVEEHMPQRTFEDFRRMYEMALQAQLDPEVDVETKRWAKKFAREWNRGQLLSLEEELAKISDHKKAALVEAQKTRPDIAASDDHKLQFLRCEDFDAKRASQRLVKYWECKFDLFGREEAFRSLTVDDLMRDHPRELSAGFYRNLLGTDAFGRALVLLVPGKTFTSLDQGCTEKGLMKVIWYIIHVLLEEEEKSCEKGLVLLVDHRHTNFSNMKPKFFFKVRPMMTDCLPIKIKAVHIFSLKTHPHFQIFLPFLKWTIGKTMRMRLWVHTGTEDETFLELQGCGISRDQIPTTLGGNIDIDELERAWLEERREAGL